MPYHPKGRVVNNQTGAMCEEWLTCATFQMFVNVTNNCRLYLRPMSSMTEEEEIEYDAIFAKPWYNSFYIDNSLNGIDWLNKYHFDYRGLIEKGLALDCTNLNIY